MNAYNLKVLRAIAEPGEHLVSEFDEYAVGELIDQGLVSVTECSIPEYAVITLSDVGEETVSRLNTVGG